jgi:hypothetical protein
MGKLAWGITLSSLHQNKLNLKALKDLRQSNYWRIPNKYAEKYTKYRLPEGSGEKAT